MKLVVSADFHINEDRRYIDTANLLQHILGEVGRIHPDYFVALGDIFDKRRPSPRELRLLNRWLLALRDCVGTGIILLEGNHDLDRDISALSYLQDLATSQVAVVHPPFKLDGFYFDHVQISGAMADNGFKMTEGHALSDIIQKNPDCHTFAFGHLHKPQILQEKPLAFYAGSLDKVTFAEDKDKKRLWVFTDSKLESCIDLPTRPMYQYHLLVTETQFSVPPWSGVDLTGAMVKVIFSGTREALKSVDSAQLHQYLSSRGVYSLKIAFDITDKAVPRNEVINESVSEQAALEEFFKDHLNKETLVSQGLLIIKETLNG
jgi:DNA repair exonuclease SbcCD nuclease subunit